MERDFKCWGERVNIFKNDLCEVSILKLKGGMRCSWHYHNHKFNKFYVLSGEVILVTEFGEIGIRPGEMFMTKPTEKHEFRVGMDSVMIEIMYVFYDTEDIVRHDIGGLIDDGERVRDTEVFLRGMEPTSDIKPAV